MTAYESSAPAAWDTIARYELAWYERKQAYDLAVREQRLQPEEVPAQFATATPPALAPNASFSELLASNPL